MVGSGTTCWVDDKCSGLLFWGLVLLGRGQAVLRPLALALVYTPKYIYGVNSQSVQCGLGMHTMHVNDKWQLNRFCVCAV